VADFKVLLVFGVVSVFKEGGVVVSVLSPPPPPQALNAKNSSKIGAALQMFIIALSIF